jgi:hypothetical protein
MMSSFGRRLSLLVVPLVLACSTSYAQKITVEYDKTTDFSRYKTYAIDPVNNAPRPMLRLAIQAAVQDDLGKRGLSKVDSNPDLYVQMYGAIDTDYTTTYFDPVYGSGIPPSNTRYEVWYTIPGTVTTVLIPKGTLMVDVIDANRKRLVWRGMAKQKLSDSRDKLLDQVNTAVEKMFQQYPAGPK